MSEWPKWDYEGMDIRGGKRTLISREVDLMLFFSALG